MSDVKTTIRYRFGAGELLPARRLLRVHGRTCRIGARALDLLQALIERRDRVVSKNELFALVWPDVVVEENNLQVHISSLRKVLGESVIATVPGRGYRFTADLEEEQGTPAIAKPLAASAAVIERAPAGNLPAEPPLLYGRAADVAAVRSLALQNRLVTIAGAGGVGKTALVHAVAHALRNSFDEGAWLVELAHVAHPAEVTTAVAAVLQVTLDEAERVDMLARGLRSSTMLLVLDNCEHVVDAVAGLAAALLQLAPGVRVLVTSQEPLRIHPEQVYRLEGLALPDCADLAHARQAGAVALFEARARAADPRFALNDRNVGTAIEICRKLDGLALAIEFAAARVALLGLDGLNRRLEERLQILVSGARIALPRHQTLRAALEWSHGLLSADEQGVFRRLAVFVGSFDLESAQAVAAGGAIDRAGVIERLGSLVDKSLVAVDGADTPRYRLLETTRAFGLERLAAAGETAETFRRHAQAMLARFEAALDDEFRVPHQRCLERYLPDLDNARAALDWSAGSAGDPSLQIGLAGAVAWMWLDAGLRPEGLRRTKAAIERIDGTTLPQLEARLVGQWARLAHPAIGPRELAANARAVQLSRALTDGKALFVALCYQVRFQTYCEEPALAEPNLAEAERLFDPAWPTGLRLLLLNTRSWLRLVQGRYDESVRGYEEVHQLAARWGDPRAVISALINVEQNLAAAGRLEESVVQGRALLRRLEGERALSAGIEHFVAVNLAISLTRLGWLDEALEVARKALPLCEKAGRLFDMLEQNALLAFKRGRAEDAARILGCADHAVATSHVRRDIVEQQQRAELEALVGAAFAPDRLATLLRDGASLAVDEAIRLALGP